MIYGVAVYIRMHTVIETNAYLAAAKDAGMGEDERDAIVDLIAADPQVGEIMPGCGGARKLRVAKPAKESRAAIVSSPISQARTCLLSSHRLREGREGFAIEGRAQCSRCPDENAQEHAVGGSHGKRCIRQDRRWPKRRDRLR